MSLDANTALQITAWIAGIGTIVSSLEFLSLRREFAPGGFYDGRLVRTDLPDMPLTALDLVLRLVFCNRAIVVLAGARLLGGVLLVGSELGGAAFGFAVALAVTTTILIHLRCQYGLDGSDQMLLIVLGALLWSAVVPRIAPVCLVFVAGQSLLSYVTAGLAKAVSTKWRSWRAMTWIMNSETYGQTSISGLLLDRPWLAAALGWTVLVVETTFPLAVVVEPLLPVYLVWGLVFHALTAIIMGLNVFFWAFVATYPAIVWVAQQL